LPVPRVASDTSAVHAPHRDVGPRRHSGAEAKQPSTPFETLLDDTGAKPPPSPHDRPDRPDRPDRSQSSSAADAANDAAPDQRVRGRRENKAENADGGDRPESADAPPPDADAKPEETSEVKAADTAEETSDEAEPVSSDAVDTTLLVAATDVQAQLQPDVGQQPPAVPAVEPATAAADADLAAAADAAIDAGGARNEQVPGATSGADAGAKTGEKKGAKGAANVGPAEAAGADVVDAGDAHPAGEAERKDVAGANLVNGSETSDTKKTPPAKPGVRAETAAAAGPDTAAPGRRGDDADSVAHAGAHATGKGEQSGADPVRPAAQSAAPKPDGTAGRPHADAQTATPADGSKPPVDAFQLTSLHPADRLANVAAQATAQAGTTGSAPVPIAALAVEIAARAQSGNNRFDIRLDPPELGRIDVRLDVDQSGQVTTRLVVEKAETLDLLRRDAPELERALQQAGLKTGDSGLQFALRDQTAGGQDTGENWRSNVAKLVVPDPEMTAAETAAAGYGRSLRLGGGIDIRV